jgi:AcrR family transcriptional regulator
MEAADRIVQAAYHLFIKFGIRSVTMDDVSREISVSKKTLYRCFKDKDELVRITIGKHIAQMNSTIEQIQQREEDPILQIVNIAEFMVHFKREINPAVLYDLRKYHPETYELLVQHRDTAAYNNIMQNIESGISKGYFRTDLDVEVVTRIWVFLVFSLFENEIFSGSEIQFERAYKEMVRYHLNGIATPAGREKFECIGWPRIENDKKVILQ